MKLTFFVTKWVGSSMTCTKHPSNFQHVFYFLLFSISLWLFSMDEFRQQCQDVSLPDKLECLYFEKAFLPSVLKRMGTFPSWRHFLSSENCVSYFMSTLILIFHMPNPVQLHLASSQIFFAIYSKSFVPLWTPAADLQLVCIKGNKSVIVVAVVWFLLEKEKNKSAPLNPL